MEATMSKKNAVIMVKLDPPAQKEAEWNNWYNNKHIPDRLAIPGFNAVRRFVQIEGRPPGFAIAGEPKYLSLYELSDVSVVKGELYTKLREKETSMPPNSFESITLKLPKFARGIYEQINPPEGGYKPPRTQFLFVVGHEVPRNRHQEFNAWYNTEHVPAVLKVPGIVAGRRFKLTKEVPPMILKGGSLTTYLTVYDVENEGALESEAFMRASVSPWSAWVRSWFQRKMCVTYKRIYP